MLNPTMPFRVRAASFAAAFMFVAALIMALAISTRRGIPAPYSSGLTIVSTALRIEPSTPALPQPHQPALPARGPQASASAQQPSLDETDSYPLNCTIWPEDRRERPRGCPPTDQVERRQVGEKIRGASEKQPGLERFARDAPKAGEHCVEAIFGGPCNALAFRRRAAAK